MSDLTAFVETLKTQQGVTGSSEPAEEDAVEEP
jgi:hypothetical protein